MKPSVIISHKRNPEFLPVSVNDSSLVFSAFVYLKNLTFVLLLNVHLEVIGFFLRCIGFFSFYKLQARFSRQNPVKSYSPQRLFPYHVSATSYR